MSPDQSNNRTASEKQWNTSLYDGKHSFVWKYGEGVIELLEPRQGERILDLGCGTGHLTSRIAAAGASVVGIDKSPAMIESARKAYPELEFIESDGTTIGFSSEFDAVFSNATIHWIKDQAALASAIWRALKPGGRFVAEFGGKGNLSAVREALKRALSNIGHHGATAGLERYYPSVGEYATLLESAGFRVTRGDSLRAADKARKRRARSERLARDLRGQRAQLTDPRGTQQGHPKRRITIAKRVVSGWELVCRLSKDSHCCDQRAVRYLRRPGNLRARPRSELRCGETMRLVVLRRPRQRGFGADR